MSGNGVSAPPRRRLLPLAVVLAVAWIVVAAPYLRALWWLHAHPEAPRNLHLPLPGLVASNLSPSFGAPRAHGPHEGIDIVADAGTPVLAVAAGIIVGNRQTPIGGTVLWILGRGRRLYYYAHMRELAPWMHLGRSVTEGEQIGSVGNTGNARYTVPHLHFGIYSVVSDLYPMKYHAIDPYPLFVTDNGG